MTEIRIKRKMKMNEPIETVLIGGHLQFDLHVFKSSSNREKRWPNIKRTKKHKNVYYKLTPVGILFPSSITSDTK